MNFVKITEQLKEALSLFDYTKAKTKELQELVKNPNWRINYNIETHQFEVFDIKTLEKEFKGSADVVEEFLRK